MTDKYQKVIWSEGMFLTPHHFQQWDRYHEMLLAERVRSMTPHGWGVTEMDLDPDGLANGNFTLLVFRGVMPDGLILRIPEQDLPPETRPLAEHFSPSLDHLDVFLGVPIERPGSINCLLNGNSGSRPVRYSAEYLKCADDNTGENPREITIARKNMRILFSGEEMSDYITIKIAELVRTPGGTITLREGYIPPSLMISASTYLTRLTHRLLEILSAKSSFLGGMRRGPNEPGMTDIPKLFLLYTVNRFIPLLAHICHVGKIHPEMLYTALSMLAGELSASSAALLPKDIPRYYHNDLSKTFKDLEQKILTVIDSMTPSQYVSIPLEIQRENVLTGRVSDEGMLKSSQFFLGASGDLPDDQICDMVPRMIKVGSFNDLDLIVSTAMPGVRLYHTPRPPQGIPIKTGHNYFRLENYGDFWESIIRSHLVAFYVPANLKILKFELLAVKE